MTEEYKVPDGMVGFSKLSGHSVAVQYCEGFYQMLFFTNTFLCFFFSPSNWQRWRADLTHTARIWM